LPAPLVRREQAADLEALVLLAGGEDPAVAGAQLAAAADRIIHSKGRYVLVNGLVVAAD